MSTNPLTILAVDPGTRELGVAVLSNRELLFYGIKTVTSRRNPQRVLETISDYLRHLLDKYRPAHLAIGKLFAAQTNSALLVVAAEQIKATAEESKLPIYEYASAIVRKRLCLTERATRRETAAVLAARFPELERYYLRSAAWEQDYYGNLFDAVAVGVVCEQDLAEGKPTRSL